MVLTRKSIYESFTITQLQTANLML